MMRNRIVWSLVVCVGMIGCGGDDPPPQPSLVPGNQQASAPQRAPVNPPANNPRNGAKNSTLLPEAVPEFAPEDLPNLFQASSTPGNFDVVPPEHPHQADEFAMVTPPSGSNSENFSIVAPSTPADKPNAADPKFKLPEGFTALPEAGYSAEGQPLRIKCDIDGSTMAFVPAGVVLMGVENGPANVTPVASVLLDAYYIDTTEVTVEQYQIFVEAQRTARKRVPGAAANASAPEDHPALGVTWIDARVYAHWAGKDLPTEAEWEKAARGEHHFDHPWGNGRATWSRTRLPGQIDPIGSFPADVSPFGVYDLAGNAREWCFDLYHQDAYKEVKAKGNARNWTGPKTSSIVNARVVRGGSPTWKLWERDGYSSRESAPDIGFRCVLRLTPNATPPATEN